MFNPKSDYALNKLDKDAIVCPSATGIHIRLTRENFVSEDEFLRWKAVSDEDYRKTECAEHIQSKNTLSLTGLFDVTTAVVSPETLLIHQQEQVEREQLRQLLIAGMDSCLTITQHRRLWLYCVDNLTEEQIALAEKVTQQSVSECIASAKKKILKFLEKSTL